MWLQCRRKATSAEMKRRRSRASPSRIHHEAVQCDRHRSRAADRHVPAERHAECRGTHRAGFQGKSYRGADRHRCPVLRGHKAVRVPDPVRGLNASPEALLALGIVTWMSWRAKPTTLPWLRPRRRRNSEMSDLAVGLVVNSRLKGHVFEVRMALGERQVHSVRAHCGRYRRRGLHGDTLFDRSMRRSSKASARWSKCLTWTEVRRGSTLPSKDFRADAPMARDGVLNCRRATSRVGLIGRSATLGVRGHRRRTVSGSSIAEVPHLVRS